jgi:two-component system response regulator HydG
LLPPFVLGGIPVYVLVGDGLFVDLRMNKKILLVEDDAVFSRLLKNFLGKNGYAVDVSASAAEAYKRLTGQRYDLAISDFRLPDDTGLSVLRWIKEHAPDTQVILMTSYSDIRTAIHSIKLGALDYIVKPLNPDELLLTLQQTFKSTSQAQPVEETAPAPGADYVIGSSEVALGLFEQVKLISPTDMSVIVQGESGTGKEYAAQLIHTLSARKESPFVAVDCGALSKELAASELFGHVKGSFTGAVADKAGQFEQATGGTLFLDEIGNLSYEVQVQLLRAIQERRIHKVGGIKDIPVDVRIIVATNDDLKVQVEKGQFREDLYHRLNEFKIQVPPLRERGPDIEFFSRFFLDRANQELHKQVEGFSPEVLDVFHRYPWPGNLREFRNVIKRAVLLTKSSLISLDCIPEDIRREAEESRPAVSPFDLKEVQMETEKEQIAKALERCKFNKSKAARLLNIDRKTLYLKIGKYNLDC